MTDTSMELEVPSGTSSLWKADDYHGIVSEAAIVAKELGAVIKQQKLTAKISGRDHVLVEGWTLLGSLVGVFPIVTWTRQLEDGWEARVEARTRHGDLVGAAEAQCTRTERTWKNRDDYALRSMAQTRATSKALRMPLGFVIHLAGFSATPFEEMPPPGPDVRAKVVVGPDIDPMDMSDFGPVTDPSLEEEPPQDIITVNQPVGSSFVAPEPRRTDTDVGPITDPQRKKIYALLSKLKRADPVLYSDDNVTDQLKLQYGTEHISELNRADARDLIDRLLQREATLSEEG